MLDSTTSKLQSAVHSAIAAALCAFMAGQPVLAEMPVTNTAPVQKRDTSPQLQGQARVLHALNRFTFGPRPGDASAVERTGLDRWFEQQLNPQSILDTALDQRLTQFPAMQLSQAELMTRFPGPQMLKQAELRGVPMPGDPVESALYRDQMEIYKKTQQGKLGESAGQQVSKSAMQPSVDTGNATDSSMQRSSPAPIVRKKAAPKVNMLGPDSTNSGNLKKPGKEAEQAGMGPANAGGLRHKEQFFPEADTQAVLTLAPEARVQRILAMTPEQMADFRRSLSMLELAQLIQGLSPQQREVLEALQGSPRMVGGELLQSRLERDIYSERQLEAVMTDFWLNHFNVYVRKNQNEPYLLPAYERDVIRPHALGKFEDLLVATAQSPAMMVYLDNWQSVGPESQAAQRQQTAAKFRPDSPAAKLRSQGLNENYGRELMELHTLGVNGGYTQKDVTEVSKVFTGWGIDRPYQGADFAFQPQRHEPGEKTVLGHMIQPGGQQEGLQVLHLLATSPATAHFISNKLAVRFVSDTPPQALVDRMAKAYLASDGDIKTVLRTMFKSPEFWTASTANAKMKTPLEFVVSAVRASGAQVVNAQALVQTLDRLGMPLYGMQTPNGYSWMAEPWSGTGDLVNRMNFALVLSGNRLNGVRVDLAGTVGNDVAPDAKEHQLEQVLLGRPVSDRTRSTVMAQFANPEIEQQAEKDFPARINMPESGEPMLVSTTMVAQDRQAAVMAGLLLGSPEFQRR